MRLCDETATVYNARVDPAKRAEVYAPTVLRGVSWRAEQASGVTDGALRAANVFILRVPEGVDAGGKRWAEPADYRAAADAGGLWTLQKGDVIVRGAAAADGQTPAALRERYGPENVLTVLGVADNRRGTRGKHWRVTGE